MVWICEANDIREITKKSIGDENKKLEATNGKTKIKVDKPNKRNLVGMRSRMENSHELRILGG